MRWRRNALILIMLSATAPMEATAQYCPFLDTWSGYAAVPVWLHPDLLVHMRHSDDTTWGSLELEHEVRWILQSVQQAYADAPYFYLAGFSDCDPDTYCRYEAAGHIQPRLVPEDEDDIEFCTKTGADVAPDPVADGRTVNLNRSKYPGEASVCDTGWEHWDTERPLDQATFGRYLTLGSILQHEFIHVLGLNDTSPTCSAPSCTTPPYCSVTELAPFLPQEAHRWFQYDVNAIRWRYGPSTAGMMTHHESHDGVTWWPVDPSGVPAFEPQADASGLVPTRVVHGELSRIGVVA